jgi:hypothetical protein
VLERGQQDPLQPPLLGLAGRLVELEPHGPPVDRADDRGDVDVVVAGPVRPDTEVPTERPASVITLTPPAAISRSTPACIWWRAASRHSR